jgi:hypothetical protein
MKSTTRKAITFVIAVAFTVACIGCGPSALEQHRRRIAKTGRSVRTHPSNGLALTIFPRQGKHTFRRPQPILIDVTLTNITNGSDRPRPINVYTEIRTDGLLLYFELWKVKEDGQLLTVYQTARKDATLEQRMKNYPNHVRLQPGFFVGRPIQFAPGTLAAGIYEMTVTYNNEYDICRLSPELTPGHLRLLDSESGNPGLVELWKGMLRSNTVVFEVLEGKAPAPPE